MLQRWLRWTYNSRLRTFLTNSVIVMLPKFCNKSGASRLSLGTFSVVRSQRKMKYVAADRQNSSGPGPTKAVLNSPNHTSLSFHHFDPLNSNLNYKESLSADARQAIISHPFVGQSGDLSYGTPIFSYLCHRSST